MRCPNDILKDILRLTQEEFNVLSVHLMGKGIVLKQVHPGAAISEEEPVARAEELAQRLVAAVNDAFVQSTAHALPSTFAAYCKSHPAVTGSTPDAVIASLKEELDKASECRARLIDLIEGRGGKCEGKK